MINIINDNHNRIPISIKKLKEILIAARESLKTATHYQVERDSIYAGDVKLAGEFKLFRMEYIKRAEYIFVKNNQAKILELARELVDKDLAEMGEKS